ncbi:MAG: DNA-directed RNA polymerase subunit B [archaeon]
MVSEAKNAKVYINGRLIGFHSDPIKLTREIIGRRRESKISAQINVAYHEDTNEVYINTDAGRVQRPLLVVENGKIRMKEEHVKQLNEGKLAWKDLIEQGLVEYLDSEEEENAFIASKEEELSKEHTHLEISGATILSIISSMVPFLEHDMVGKVLHGAKMFKQAQGFGAANFGLRTDTEGFFLYYPQKSLVKTKTMDVIGIDQRPEIQNFVVAIMPFYGFNILDAIILNKGAVDRGLGRSTYFRTYESAENRYPGGQIDKFEIPPEDTIGFLGEESYKKLGADGFVQPESFVGENEIIVGITSPPRFLEEINEFGVVQEKRRDASISIRKGKEGHVDKVFVTESESGNKLVKVKVRSERVPALGDKFSSRHGQKGVVGLIVPEEDMPFTPDGIKPDLILNPHSLPSRMTIGHMIEMLGGKAAAMKGMHIDGTPFEGTKEEEIEKMLDEAGFKKNGREVFYDGTTGKRINAEIFTGIVAYRRLFHMTAHKIQSRAKGPVQILTRQPTEGKEKEGGLRFGEMEGETLVGHGAAMLLQEKFIDDSDKVTMWVSETAGVIGFEDQIRKTRRVLEASDSKIYAVEMSYGFKLLLDELKALGVYPKLILKDKV